MKNKRTEEQNKDEHTYKIYTTNTCCYTKNIHIIMSVYCEPSKGETLLDEKYMKLNLGVLNIC